MDKKWSQLEISPKGESGRIPCSGVETKVAKALNTRILSGDGPYKQKENQHWEMRIRNTSKKRTHNAKGHSGSETIYLG